jgi:RNA polymerase sigma factor (sigma-70 family)
MPPSVTTNSHVTDLVTGARKGDQQAWDALVARYSPLIWSICRRYRLSESDAEDVCQAVWVRLVDQLDSLRDAAALPGWLSTTTRHECSRVGRATCRHATAGPVLDFENIPDQLTEAADHGLLLAERHATLHEAVRRLPPGCRRLLALLIADPPVPYAEISGRLGMSIGSIGPSRRRCLDRLRDDPAIAALMDAEAGSATREQPVGSST